MGGRATLVDVVKVLVEIRDELKRGNELRQRTGDANCDHDEHVWGPTQGDSDDRWHACLRCGEGRNV